MSIDGMEVGRRIKSSKEVYWHLRETLHCTHKKMPFSYEEYTSNFRIIGLDLTVTEDGYLKVLQKKKTAGDLKVEMIFTVTNINLVVLCGGIQK